MEKLFTHSVNLFISNKFLKKKKKHKVHQKQSKLHGVELIISQWMALFLTYWAVQKVHTYEKTWTKFLANSIFPEINGVSCETDQTPLGLPNTIGRQATWCQAVGDRMYFCPVTALKVFDLSLQIHSYPLPSFSVFREADLGFAR